MDFLLTLKPYIFCFLFINAAKKLWVAFNYINTLNIDKTKSTDTHILIIIYAYILNIHIYLDI